MLKTYEIVIGIDPDASKSGVGVVFNADKQLSASVMDFPTLCRYLDGMRGQSVLVIVEAGWLVSSNWHLIGRKGVAWAASVGRSVGMNHQTGILIAQMARSYGLEVREQRPLKKIWRGKDGKISAEELRRLTGYIGRTNQDARDALLLAWTYKNEKYFAKCLEDKHL